MSITANVRLQVYATVQIPDYLMTAAGNHAQTQPGVGHDDVKSFLLASMQDPDLHRYVTWSYVQIGSGHMGPALAAPKEAPA